MKHLSTPPKLLLFDLDGTLLDSRKQISPRNLAAIEACRVRGILIGVATARGEATCARYVEQIQPDVVISNSGGLVRIHGEIVYSNAFTVEETIALVRAGTAEKRGVTVDTAAHSYCNVQLDMSGWNDVELTDYSEASGFHERAFKVCIEGTDIDFAERTAALVEDCDWLAFSDCDWFKFSRRDNDKGRALAALEQAMGVTPEEIIAFGDDYVDAAMLQTCGMGVAMGNAVEEVRRCADVVIGDNDSDAIAGFLEQRVL